MKKKPKGKPRQEKLFPPQTDERHPGERAADALRAGHTMAAAAGKAGVTRETLYQWYRRSDVLRQARAEGQAALEEAVLRDAKENGAFALEVLSRRCRAWQRKDRSDVQVTDVTGTEDRTVRIARLKSVVAALESAEERDDDPA